MQLNSSTHSAIVTGVLALSQLLIMPVAIADPANTTSATLKKLSSFLAELEIKHPLLKANRAEIDAARARSRAASRSIYNPEIELDTERTGFNRNNVDTTTIGINQTFDWNDKRSARKNVATIALKVTQFEQEEAHQQLLANIFSALADYQAQREILQAHNKRLSLAKQVLSQATRLYKAGDISKLDLEQLRLSQTKAQLIFNLAKTRLVAQSQDLAAISGVARKTWPALPYAPPVPAGRAVLSQSYGQILTNLPAIKADITRIAKARSIMRLRVREQKPDPTIGFRVGGEDSEKVFGLTLSIPLNVRNNYQAEVDETLANISHAESTLENSRHRLKTRLQSAAQTYRLSYSNWQSWQKIASSSLNKQSHLLMRLWKAGELSTSDYLLQLNQIKEAELNNVELKGNVWKVWFNWLAISNQFKQWLNGNKMGNK